jgi:hypothetical protein
MSDLLAEGVQVVRSAEESLRELMQTAVREGQYDRVTVLASWAELLSRIPDDNNATSYEGPKKEMHRKTFGLAVSVGEIVDG